MSDLKRGVQRLASNYTRLGSTLLLGIIEVPLLLLWVGVDAFGVITLLGPTIGIGSIVMEVINQALVREIGAAWHTGDQREFQRTYRSAWVISLLTALATAPIFAILIFLILPNLSIGDELLPAAQVMGAAMAALAMVSIALSPLLVTLLVRERFVIHNFTLVVQRAAGLIAAVLGLAIIGKGEPAQGVMFYGIVSAGLMILVTITTAGIILFGDRSLAPRPGRGAVRSIARTFGWNTLAIVSLNLGDRIPLVLVNYFFGNTGSAIYGVAWRLGAYARMITVGATFGLEAVSTRLSSTDKSGEAIRRFLGHSTRINTTIALPAAVCISLLAEPLLRLWIARSLENPERVIEQAVIITQLVVVTLVIRGISEGWIRILYGDGHVRRYAPFIAGLSLATPILCIAAALLLPEPWDFRGIAAVFAATAVIGYLGVLPSIGAKALGVPRSAFYRPMLAPALATLVVPPILGGLWLLQTDWTLPILFAAVAGSAAVYAAAAWRLVLTPEERKMLASRARVLSGGGKAPNSGVDPTE